MGSTTRGFSTHTAAFSQHTAADSKRISVCFAQSFEHKWIWPFNTCFRTNLPIGHLAKRWMVRKAILGEGLERGLMEAACGGNPQRRTNSRLDFTM